MRLTEIVATLRPQGEDFVVDTPADWTQGRTLFGGLQAALLVHAMRQRIGADIPLRSLQTTFVGPVGTGRLALRARVLRTGKSAIHVEAQIVDDGQVLCTAIAVFGRARRSVLEIALPAARAARSPEASLQIPWVPGVSPDFTGYLEQRWAQGAFPFGAGAEPRTQVHLRYRDEPVVNESLLIALGDSIPSPAISILDRPAAASSLCWTLELLRDRWPTSGDGWWLMQAEASAAADGYVYQAATLYDPEGSAVALSRQSAVVFG